MVETASEVTRLQIYIGLKESTEMAIMSARARRCDDTERTNLCPRPRQHHINNTILSCTDGAPAARLLYRAQRQERRARSRCRRAARVPATARACARWPVLPQLAASNRCRTATALTPHAPLSRPHPHSPGDALLHSDSSFPLSFWSTKSLRLTDCFITMVSGVRCWWAWYWSFHEEVYTGTRGVVL